MEAEAGSFIKFEENPEIVAIAPVITFEVEEVASDSGLERGDITIGIEGIEACPNCPLLGDAEGDGGVEVEGEKIAVIGDSPCREGGGVVGFQPVSGITSEADGNLLVEPLCEVGKRNDGIGYDVTVANRAAIKTVSFGVNVWEDKVRSDCERLIMPQIGPY